MISFQGPASTCPEAKGLGGFVRIYIDNGSTFVQGRLRVIKPVEAEDSVEIVDFSFAQSIKSDLDSWCGAYAATVVKLSLRVEVDESLHELNSYANLSNHQEEIQLVTTMLTF